MIKPLLYVCEVIKLIYRTIKSCNVQGYYRVLSELGILSPPVQKYWTNNILPAVLIILEIRKNCSERLYIAVFVILMKK